AKRRDAVARRRVRFLLRHGRGHERDESVAVVLGIELQRLSVGILGLSRAEAQSLPLAGVRCEGAFDVLALRQCRSGEQDEGDVLRFGFRLRGSAKRREWPEQRDRDTGEGSPSSGGNDVPAGPTHATHAAPYKSRAGLGAGWGTRP